MKSNTSKTLVTLTVIVNFNHCTLDASAKFTLKRICISHIKGPEKNLFSLNLKSGGGRKNCLYQVHWVLVILTETILCSYFKGDIGEY